MDAPVPPDEAAAEARPQSWRGLVNLAFEALRTRLDLAAVEFEIYVRALVRMLIWAVAAVASALFAVAFAVTALMMALWNTHRMLGLLGASVLFIGLTALFVWLGVRTLRAQPGVLQGSLQQLQEDQRRAGGAP
jgi:uncharacterized membrane protein YqjE